MAGRTEDGKERDPNQSSSKMDGARRGIEKRRRREGSIVVEGLRRMQGEGRSAWRKGGFNRSCEGKMDGGPASFRAPLPILPPASLVQSLGLALCDAPLWSAQ